MRVPDGFRSLGFLDGTRYVVPADTCRGCLMNEMEGQLSDLLDPVYDDGTITVRQDAEWAVPGFMIVAVRAHVGALDEMPLRTAARVLAVTRAVRRSMRQTLGLRAGRCHSLGATVQVRRVARGSAETVDARGA